MVVITEQDSPAGEPGVFAEVCTPPTSPEAVSPKTIPVRKGEVKCDHDDGSHQSQTGHVKTLAELPQRAQTRRREKAKLLPHHHHHYHNRHSHVQDTPPFAAARPPPSNARTLAEDFRAFAGRNRFNDGYYPPWLHHFTPGASVHFDQHGTPTVLNASYPYSLLHQRFQYLPDSTVQDLVEPHTTTNIAAIMPSHQQHQLHQAHGGHSPAHFNPPTGPANPFGHARNHGHNQHPPPPQQQQQQQQYRGGGVNTHFTPLEPTIPHMTAQQQYGFVRPVDVLHGYIQGFGHELDKLMVSVNGHPHPPMPMPMPTTAQGQCNTQPDTANGADGAKTTTSMPSGGAGAFPDPELNAFKEDVMNRLMVEIVPALGQLVARVGGAVRDGLYHNNGSVKVFSGGPAVGAGFAPRTPVPPQQQHHHHHQHEQPPPYHFGDRGAGQHPGHAGQFGPWLSGTPVGADNGDAGYGGLADGAGRGRHGP